MFGARQDLVEKEPGQLRIGGNEIEVRGDTRFQPFHNRQIGITDSHGNRLRKERDVFATMRSNRYSFLRK